jgi:hypothetical protein
MTRAALALLFLQAFLPAAFAAAAPAIGTASPTALPSVSATFTGSPQTVYDTHTQACDREDAPDTRPRAFRDDNGMVHLVSTDSTARAMVGPTLDTVKQDCRVLYHSRQDADPSHFQDQTWLTSFFSVDGRRIVALAHTEYHGYSHPGMCVNGTGPGERLANCWWNTIAFAQSSDGGYSFTEPTPPQNLVASLPYQYDRQSRSGPHGYFTPSNILKLGDFYYATIASSGYKAQKPGACLIRTANLFDPASWRAWDGTSFSVRFIDPYVEPDAPPEEHICAPVSPSLGDAQSLSVDERTGLFVATQLTGGDRYGPEGVYLTASADLIHWSKPTLLISTVELLTTEAPGNWRNMYVALLDPASKDRNFSTITDSPYLYYVRLDLNHPANGRIISRRQIKLQVTP